jgi:peptidyl-prolyl cis-trans isomerase D
MSIIQKIQEKYAKLMAVIIALALIIFVVMLAFENGGGLFTGSNTVGKVDGETISGESFTWKVQAYSRNAQGQGEFATAQAVEQAWNETVDSILLAREASRLGLMVSDREISNLIFSQNAPNEFKQIFTNPETGIYDPAVARQQLQQVRKQGSLEQKQYVNALIDYIERQTLQSKYVSLMANTANFPKWLLEKRNVDNSLIARLSYVTVPYTSISDSAVKVTDSEIEAYVSSHKKDFERKEETRNISYVTFSAEPSAADSAATRSALQDLKPQFDTMTVYENFINRNSSLPYYGGLISRNAIQHLNKDSILAQPVGTVYGPYLDQAQNAASNFVMSKVIEVRPIADTVKIRHILIATQQRTQEGAMVPVREDSTARRIIDSIATAHRAGSSFDTLVARLSEDPGSKDKGGVYENVTSGNMVPSFNDFIFTGRTGQTGVVKTEYGYHYIEILSQKGSSTGYRIAYLAKPILTSDETESAAQNAAAQFASSSTNTKTFNENWEKNLRARGINRASATDLRAIDFSIQGLNGVGRSLVRQVFEADRGDVVGPEKVGTGYVVALVTDVNKPGVASAAQVRSAIEPILRNKKKAAQITKEIGNVGSNLDEVAARLRQPVQVADSVRFSGGNSVFGYEPKVVGAAFNPANKGKVVSTPIAGQLGVYILRVDNTSTVPVEAASIADQRRMLEMQNRQQMQQQMQYGGGNPFMESLKRAAKIEDKRASIY